MHSLIFKLSRLVAYAGGAVLSVLIVMTCVSIIGRSASRLLNSDLVQAYAGTLADFMLAAGVGPIKGDIELDEAGMALAIFAFLPLCQITSGHDVVDVFSSRLGPTAQRVLIWVSDFLFAGVLILITVQLYAGLQSKMRSGQTTFLLEFPVWWAYALSLAGALVATMAAVYVAVERSRELITGHSALHALADNTDVHSNAPQSEQ